MITGCIPDSLDRRLRDSLECQFSTVAQDYGSATHVEQLVPWLPTQAEHPACVGLTAMEGVNGVIAAARGLPTASRSTPPDAGPWASGMALWTGARRRQGRLEDTDKGTRLQYVVDEIVERGWQPYRLGEERDPESPLDRQQSLRDEMFAHDQRAPQAKRWRISGTLQQRVELLVSALSDRRNAVLASFYLRPGFGRVRVGPQDRDVVITREHIGGRATSHAMRPFGAQWDAKLGAWLFATQNHWVNKGGMHRASGEFLGQCYLLHQQCFDPARCKDIWVVQPRVNL